MLALLVALTLFSVTETVVEEAGLTLRRDPVFVHADAERTLSPEEEAKLRERVRSAGRPVFVAVLPAAAEEEAGGLDRLPAALGEATGLGGTYAVVTGNGFRAGSNALPRGVAGELATGAFQSRQEAGTYAVLEEFVTRVGNFDDAGSSAPGNEPAGRREGGGGGGLLLPLVILGGATAGGVYLFTKRRRGQVALQSVLSGDREDLRAELAVVADDVVRLESEVALHPDARDDYEAAVGRFRWAQVAVEGIDSPDDVPRVRRALAEAGYAMARVRAILRGEEPPPPPAQLQAPGPQGEPAVELDDRRRPVYAGYGGDDGGWGGGGFFGGNGLFTGLLLGQMLGGGFGWGGPGRSGGEAGQRPGGWGDGGAGDDVGGGDWGGGDFGGGDVGGGDWN